MVRASHVAMRALLFVLVTIMTAGCADQAPAETYAPGPADAPTDVDVASGQQGEPGEPGQAGAGCTNESTNVASPGACQAGEATPPSANESAQASPGGQGGEGGEGCPEGGLNIASEGSCEQGEGGDDGTP